MNLQETIYHEGHLLGDITFQSLMLDYCDGYTDNECEEFVVVWYEDKFEDVVVKQIYNHDTGEILWEDKPEEDWTDNDDQILTELLMFGELRETIGSYYV